MKIFIIIAFVLLFFFGIYTYFKFRLKHHDECITAFTGGLGSGKTFLSVVEVKKRFRKFKRQERIKKLLHKPYRTVEIYSNIPLYIKNYGMAKKLKIEHLLLQEKLDGRPILLVDEIGAFASQFEYNNPNVIITFDEFIRFYRHYTEEGAIICNDQCSENIVLVVRRRLNKIHNLSNFVKIGFLYFYFERMINISEEIKTIDERKENEKDTQDNMSLKFGIAFNIKKNYDSHCFSERYNSVPLKSDSNYIKLKTNVAISCPKSNKKTDDYFKSLTTKVDALD